MDSQITHVIKRSGAIVPFNRDRIVNAIYRAAVTVGGRDRKRAEQLADQVVAYLEQSTLPGQMPHIEEIQDIVEKVLIENGHVQLACIHDPVRQESFTARRGGGAQLNGRVIRCSNEDKLANAVGFIDFKRLDQETAKRIAAKRSYRSQRNIGTCALEWAWLAAGRAQFIIHGGEKIWDFAAGSLIAEEAGCQVGNFSAEPLFPRQGLSSPILATCMPSLQRELQHQLIL